jgi:hypothetical protein
MRHIFISLPDTSGQSGWGDGRPARQRTGAGAEEAGRGGDGPLPARCSWHELHVSALEGLVRCAGLFPRLLAGW